jgi:hypothetical protein
MSYQRPLRWIEMIDDLTSVEFLLSIRFAGRDFYFSTRPRVLLDERGEPIQYDGGLEANWTDALNLFNESPTLLAVPLALFFPADIAELIAAGYDLWRGTGELSLWIEGRPYEDRVILIDGSMVDPSYGAAGEPVKFSLEANGFQDTGITHTPTQKVTRETWTSPAPSALDLYYPIVFGTPGVYKESDGTAATTYGSPALVVNDGVLGGTLTALIAGHEVQASTVTATNISVDPIVSGVLSVAKTTDLLGQTVSTVDISTLGYNAGNEIWITWDQPSGGGLWNERRTDARTGAGELIQFFIRLSTLKFDVGIWRSVGRPLDQAFNFSGYIDEAVRPWKYLEQNFFPLLPISVFSTASGVACVVWRKDAQKSDAIGTITAGGGVFRVGPVQYEKQDLANDIRLSFALDAEDGRQIRTVGVIGDREPDPATERDLFSTEYSRASFFRYGPAAASIKTDIIYETATAINVLQWNHRLRALPYRVVKYRVPIRLGFLRRGDLVLVADPEIYLADYLGFVRNIDWNDGKPTLSIVLVDDPPREDR